MLRHCHVAAERPWQIGPYRILRELGRGGMGRVYEAEHVGLGKRVAIKVLRGHLLDDPVSVERFLREGRVACQVDHPNVVMMHELGISGTMPYLVMELLKGKNLREHLRPGVPLTIDEVASILLPVVSAVAAAHAAGVVHRDLKPSNIMLSLSPEGDVVPKVLDFGTSKLLADQDDPLTLTGAVLGTLDYMSPEQTSSPRNASAFTDQYSLGVIAYEAATGHRPFAGESSYALMCAIMNDPVRPPSHIVPALPQAFDELVRRAMRRSVRGRYASLREFGAALLPFAPEDVARRYRRELGSEGRVEAPAAERASTPAPALDWPQAPPEPSTLADHATPDTRAYSIYGVAMVLVVVGLAASRWPSWGRLPDTSPDQTARNVSGPRAGSEQRTSWTPPPWTQWAVATPMPIDPSQIPSAPVDGERARGEIRKQKRGPAGRRTVLLGDNDAPILE